MATTRKKAGRGAGKTPPRTGGAGTSLARYWKKRDFSRTAEPAGDPQRAAKAARRAGTAGGPLQFVIQKHAATRLHFDLRLEAAGVMKSWAVPKGPSLDPAVKRLAMEVEDHPMEYNTFEGTIPKGQYGGGTVMLWDRGTYAPDDIEPGEDAQAAVLRGLRAGKLAFTFHGERLRGSFALVRTRRDEEKPQWLLIKHRDRHASATRDIVAETTTSVASRRTMEQLAAGGDVWHSNRAGKTGKTGTTGKAPTAGKAPKTAKPEAGRRRVGRHTVALTNLDKVFWPGLGLTKGDLLRYYERVAKVLVPHLRDRAMVMKRYPNGIAGKFFFMKRAPEERPEWIETCAIEHDSGSVIDFPVVRDLASLLWVVNLGCIDLNPWYSRCDAVGVPDYLVFDLDPVPGATFGKVRETALALREMLDALGFPAYAKTSGSKGIHVYVPIRRGPEQKQVWALAKALAFEMEARHPKLVTAEYRKAKRPAGRVLVDYNQNRWGATLASVYSVRPRPTATVSAPVSWEEIEAGVGIEDFTMETVPERVADLGDLWKPMLAARGRANLGRLL